MDKNNKVKELYVPLLEPELGYEELSTLGEVEEMIGWNTNMREMKDRSICKRYV